jgi:bacteriocin biosynthesis cyclodehydratase domain-containing protein
MPKDRLFCLAPGMEIVELGDARFQFRTDFVAVEMSGDAAAVFVGHALAGLTEPRSFDEIAASLPEYRHDSLLEQLDALVENGVLVVSERSDELDGGGNRPFRQLLDEIGLDAATTVRRLAAQTVAIFGLEAHGAHVANMLADVGVGTLILVDRYPFGEVHRYLTPVSDPAAVGMSRQAAVAARVSREGLRVECPAVGEAGERGVVADVVGRCDLAVACWDRGMVAAHHWINEAALASGTPALFSELRAASCFAGPLLFPSRSACFMCYRMRTLACEVDFETAMAYEEHMDHRRMPSLADRPVLPILPVHLSSILGLEALRYLIRLNQPRLVDRVVEFDALESETRWHPVLIEPACPACGKKNASAPTRTALSSA